MSDASNNNTSRRRLGFLILGVVCVLGALGYGAYWFLDARFYESTDDAYVGGDIVVVTSREIATAQRLQTAHEPKLQSLR